MSNLDDRSAAAFLGCSVALMRRMRRENRGPRWTRIGRLVRYPENWLLEYLEEHSSANRKAADLKSAAQRGQR